jgi:tRNA dimethylallyltransferase
MPEKGQEPILIAGQTASGKSGLALAIARQVGGVVINADSMQVYTDLAVLTARPSITEMEGIPHRLYGHVAAAEPYSVGRWLAEVASVLEELARTSHRAVIVGGTGLYFKALLEGLSPVPAIPDDVRAKWRQAAADPAVDLHAQLATRDPEGAARLNPSDRQRLARALEVVDATGKTLGDWQRREQPSLIDPRRAIKLVVDIDRAELYRRCDTRLDRMIERGALDEVASLVALGLSPELPVMRALGVRPLAAHLAGKLSLAEAVGLAKTETRQYAKRQMTWLRGNMIAWHWLPAQELKSLPGHLLSFI